MLFLIPANHFKVHLQPYTNRF